MTATNTLLMIEEHGLTVVFKGLRMELQRLMLLTLEQTYSVLRGADEIGANTTNAQIAEIVVYDRQLQDHEREECIITSLKNGLMSHIKEAAKKSIQLTIVPSMVNTRLISMDIRPMPP